MSAAISGLLNSVSRTARADSRRKRDLRPAERAALRVPRNRLATGGTRLGLLHPPTPEKENRNADGESNWDHEPCVGCEDCSSRFERKDHRQAHDEEGDGRGQTRLRLGDANRAESFRRGPDAHVRSLIERSGDSVSLGRRCPQNQPPISGLSSPLSSRAR